MATELTTATSNGNDVRMREKKVLSSKANGENEDDKKPSLSTAEVTSTAETPSRTAESVIFEQAFFLGLTLEDALKSTENPAELFYNACKYNHLELVKRCLEEKKVNINEPYNNDYPLCIAR